MVSAWITTPRNNGTSEVWVADDGNAYDWNTINYHRDEHRQTYGYDISWDDGSKDKVDLDYTNSADWSSRSSHYDDVGRVLSDRVWFDNGQQTMTMYDTYNQDSWNAAYFKWDAAGGLYDKLTYNDDGSSEHTQYNLSNPAADWTQMTAYTNKDHQVTDEWMTLRDGSQIHTQHDYNDTHSWREMDATYDSNGDLEHWTYIYDDGHQVYHHV